MDKDPQIANKEKEQSQKPLIKVGLTVGDINGIGPEVLIKALKDNRILTDIIPVIYGSNKVVSFYKKHLNLQDFNYQSCKSADEVSAKKINVVNVWQDEIEIEPGQSNADGGKYALLSLEAATKDLYHLPPEEDKLVPTVCHSLDQALEHLDKDRAFLTKGGVFTDSMIDAYIDLKMQEVTRFRMATHPIEFDMYYSL